MNNSEVTDKLNLQLNQLVALISNWDSSVLTSERILQIPLDQRQKNLHLHSLNNQFNPKEPIHVKTLLSFENSLFIDQLYHFILNRQPDEAGFKFHYSHLKDKKKTKIQIIKNIRWSKEGRSQKKAITGFYYFIFLDFLHRRFGINIKPFLSFDKIS